MEERKNFYENTHIKSRRRGRDVGKSIVGENEKLLNPLNAETGLWDPIFELEEDARTHTRVHLL
jgi:hypothetical protein